MKQISRMKLFSFVKFVPFVQIRDCFLIEQVEIQVHIITLRSKATPRILRNLIAQDIHPGRKIARDIRPT